MTSIQIDIQDDMLHLFGMERIKQLIAEELAYQRFRILEEAVQQSLQEAKQTDWTKAFEDAREVAYQQYIYMRRKA